MIVWKAKHFPYEGYTIYQKEMEGMEITSEVRREKAFQEDEGLFYLKEDVDKAIEKAKEKFLKRMCEEYCPEEFFEGVMARFKEALKEFEEVREK